MSCRLLVKNISNKYSTGDVISVVDSDHLFGKYESKTEFVKYFNAKDWPRQFVIINIVDADKEELEFLLDMHEEKRKHYLTPQGEDSPYYPTLLDKAEITTTKSVLLSLVNDRST